MDLSKRWAPAPPFDGGTVRMEAPVDREVLAGLRVLQGEEETDIVAELAGVFLGDARSGLEEVEEALRPSTTAETQSATSPKTRKAELVQAFCPAESGVSSTAGAATQNRTAATSRIIPKSRVRLTPFVLRGSSSALCLFSCSFIVASP